MSYHYMPMEHVPKPSQRLAKKLRESLLATQAPKILKVLESDATIPLKLY